MGSVHAFVNIHTPPSAPFVSDIANTDTQFTAAFLRTFSGPTRPLGKWTHIDDDVIIDFHRFRGSRAAARVVSDPILALQSSLRIPHDPEERVADLEGRVSRLLESDRRTLRATPQSRFASPPPSSAGYKPGCKIPLFKLEDKGPVSGGFRHRRSSVWVSFTSSHLSHTFPMVRHSSTSTHVPFWSRYPSGHTQWKFSLVSRLISQTRGSSQLEFWQ